MSSKTKVYALAARTGADVRINIAERGHLDVEVAAPAGRHWESGVHALVGAQDTGESAEEVWRDVLDRMNEGLFPCSTRCSDWPVQPASSNVGVAPSPSLPVAHAQPQHPPLASRGVRRGPVPCEDRS
jgi:hypothetical protein